MVASCNICIVLSYITGLHHLFFFFFQVSAFSYVVLKLYQQIPNNRESERLCLLRAIPEESEDDCGEVIQDES